MTTNTYILFGLLIIASILVVLVAKKQQKN